MRRPSGIAILVILASALATRATATPLVVDSGWQPVDWNCGLGSVGAAQCGLSPDTPADGFYAFELLSPGLLTFTDMFTAGDEFILTINATNYATSPVAAGDFGFEPAGCEGNFMQAGCAFGFSPQTTARFNELATYYFGAGKTSTLQLALGPGLYTVMFTLTAEAPDTATPDPDDLQPRGLGGVRVDAVPEPASLLLLGTGLSGIAVRLRRRRRVL